MDEKVDIAKNQIQVYMYIVYSTLIT